MSNVIKLSIILLFVLFLFTSYEDAKKEKQKSPAVTEAQKQAKELDNQRFKAYTDGFILLKKKMKDPSSFDVESACVMPNMTVCYKYRAKNSFGALDLGVAYVTQTSYATSDQDGFMQGFKKECDMTQCVSVK